MVVLTNHSQDVGGGSVKKRERYSLGRISLRWMVRECFKARTGIMFKSEALHNLGLDPSQLYPDPSKLFPAVLPRPLPLPVGSQPYKEPVPKQLPLIRHWLFRDEENSEKSVKKDPVESEEKEDLKDALSPMYHQHRR